MYLFSILAADGLKLNAKYNHKLNSSRKLPALSGEMLLSFRVTTRPGGFACMPHTSCLPHNPYHSNVTG
jgi:hypothetical protein